MKSAKEMFEELDFELDDCSNFEGKAKCLNYQIIKPYDCIFKEITFYLETKEIGWDNVMLTIPLLKAINKQVEELHWNDTTVNIDVKLDGKKVMEAMRGE